MKVGRILALLAGGAAVAGAAWYWGKKRKEAEQSVLYSEEFDEATEALNASEEVATEEQPE